jgi:hypothetical protein
MTLVVIPKYLVKSRSDKHFYVERDYKANIWNPGYSYFDVKVVSLFSAM